MKEKKESFDFKVKKEKNDNIIMQMNLFKDPASTEWTKTTLCGVPEY
jgi:hypothetical protein